MGVAAYPKKVQVSLNNSTFYDLPAGSATFNRGATVLDDTEFKNNAGYRSRILGLFDWSLSVDALYIASDNALAACLTAFTTRAALYFKYLPDGTNGFTGVGKIENYNMSGDVDGLEKVTTTLQCSGAITTTP